MADLILNVVTENLVLEVSDTMQNVTLDLNSALGPLNRGITAFRSGIPTDGEVVAGGIAPFDVTFSVDRSVAKAQHAPTFESVFVIKAEGNAIGTITFASGSTEGVIQFTNNVIYAGQVVIITGPDPRDPTLADLTFLIRD